MSLNFANNNSLSAITALPASITGGSLNLISTSTASSSSSLSFTSGIDSTYKEYIFKFINMHPVTDTAKLQVNFRDGSSAFDATKNTTVFNAQHNEAGSSTELSIQAGNDIAQGTGYQDLTRNTGNGNDESTSGYLHLFDPSNTTFVKHFMCESNSYFGNDQTENLHIAGYCNVTAAIDGVDFKFSSGNIDSGVIKLYGVS